MSQSMWKHSAWACGELVLLQTNLINWSGLVYYVYEQKRKKEIFKRYIKQWHCLVNSRHNPGQFEIMS